MRRIAIALLLAVALAAPAAAGGDVRVSRDVVYAQRGGVAVSLDVYRPPTVGRHRPAVILIHGGGFRRGDKAALAPFGMRLAGRGWVAFSVNYRLAPQFLFPAGVEDVRAAVRWVREHAQRYGVDPPRIGALGSSAGANLAAILGTWGSGRLDRGSRIAAYVSWSGPMDFSIEARARDASSVAHPYLGCSLDQCPETWANASPITHVDRTDAPAFLANSLDEIVPVANATAMAERLRAVNVPTTVRLVPGSRHATAYAEDVWADTLSFFDRYLVRR
ncbi:MAG TPA: alpha/beta hydrolase [Gaiellaceae bacterium]